MMNKENKAYLKRIKKALEVGELKHLSESAIIVSYAKEGDDEIYSVSTGKVRLKMEFVYENPRGREAWETFKKRNGFKYLELR